MHQLSADQFEEAVDFDPAWASKLTEPVVITEFCELIGSNITHLSPLLLFNGQDLTVGAASFHFCKSLKVAEGTFYGRFYTGTSGIEKIGTLAITRPDGEGNAASFWRCKSLRLAEGTFPGFVDFSESGIEKIGKLIITQPNDRGEYLCVKGSPIAKKICELRKVFQGKSLQELNAALQATQDDSVKGGCLKTALQKLNSESKKPCTKSQPNNSNRLSHLIPHGHPNSQNP